LTENKRLSGRGFGRQWTPRGHLGASGLHADSETPSQKLALAVPLRTRLPR
jgi:hypothetical protein